MQAKLFVGKYEKEDRDALLRSQGYASCIEFDGSNYKKQSTSPFCLGQSDVIIYHLAGFMTILEKTVACNGDNRPIVLCNITEYLDENNSFEAYINKMRKFGRDIFIFSDYNEICKSLILAVRVIDYSKYNEERQDD